MNRNTHNSISIKAAPEASQRDAITSTESHLITDDEPPAPTSSTYASFCWLYNYIKMGASRLANDLYTSFLIYWYPNQVFLPPHIAHLMQVQSRLRAERESHTVTYSREYPGGHLQPLSMRNYFTAFKSCILSSEDVAEVHYTSKDLDYLASDREPMFVIVDSSSVSNPSSKELLIENRFHARDTALKKHFIKNVKPVDVPSTSRDLRNDLLAPLVKESESSNEMQMIDINLQSENELSVGDSEGDNDSIVISYLKNKDAFLDLEEVSEDSLDVLIPSFPGSPRSYSDDTISSSLELEPSHFSEDLITKKYKQAIEFLHHDNDFLIAAEMGDENMLQILIAQGALINDIDHLGRNALHLAVCSGNRHAVAMLLKAGVNPNVKDNVGMTPLSLCLMRRPSLRMARMLFEHGAILMPRLSPMDSGLFLQMVMMCEPTKEEEKILRLLVEKGAIVNDPEAPGGRQALHFAAMSNNTKLINLLVDLGANLFALNHRDQTPKEVAATFDCKEAFALLNELEGSLGIFPETGSYHSHNSKNLSLD